MHGEEREVCEYEYQKCSIRNLVAQLILTAELRSIKGPILQKKVDVRGQQKSYVSWKKKGC